MLDVGTDAHQIVDGVSVADAHDILFDDWSLVEHLGDIVGCRADKFDPVLPFPPLGAAPMKAGRNEWWMLIIGAPTAARNSGKDLHIACRHHQIDVAAQ